MRLPWARRRTPSGLTVVASGAQAVVGGGPLPKALVGKRQDWEADAWNAYDVIGPVGFIIDYIASAISKVRVFPAVQPDPDEPPIPVDSPDSGVPPELAQAALDFWELYRDPVGGQPALLRAQAIHWQVPGSCFVVGFPPDENDEERWEIRSSDNVKVRPSSGKNDPGSVEFRGAPSDRWETAPPGTYVARMWQPHPRWPSLATSPLRRVLGDCDEYVMHCLAVMAETQSRVPAGATLIPEELDPQGAADPTAGPAAARQSVAERLMKAQMTAIASPGDASSLVPVSITGKAEYLKEFRHVTFGRTTEGVASEQRAESLKRIAMGLDPPPELMLGLGETNRWNANTITNAVYDGCMDPLLVAMLGNLAAVYLHARLLQEGFPSAAVRGLILAVDASNVATDPAQAENAVKAYDRGLIKGPSARKALSFGEDDAPEIEELRQRQELGLIRGPQETRTSPFDPAATVTAAAIRAVPRGTPGRTFARADLGLLAGQRVAADAHLRRALDRAGARARSKTARDRAVAASLAGVPAGEVCARLGRRALLAAGLGDDELLDGALDGLEPQWRGAVRAVRSSAISTAARAFTLDSEWLDRDTAAEFTAAEDDGWRWYEGALMALLLGILYGGAPTVAPPGEADLSLLAPPSLVRESIARAGGSAPVRDGAALVTAGGLPPGGVATGPILQGVLNRMGWNVRGWQWDYGDPGARRRNFEPHMNLDGIEFTSWTDASLTNHDDFPDGDFYRIADHEGCMCGAAPLYGEQALAASAGTFGLRR